MRAICVLGIISYIVFALPQSVLAQLYAINTVASISEDGSCLIDSDPPQQEEVYDRIKLLCGVVRLMTDQEVLVSLHQLTVLLEGMEYPDYFTLAIIYNEHGNPLTAAYAQGRKFPQDMIFNMTLMGLMEKVRKTNPFQEKPLDEGSAIAVSARISERRYECITPKIEDPILFYEMNFFCLGIYRIRELIPAADVRGGKIRQEIDPISGERSIELMLELGNGEHVESKQTALNGNLLRELIFVMTFFELSKTLAEKYGVKFDEESEKMKIRI